MTENRGRTYLLVMYKDYELTMDGILNIHETNNGSRFRVFENLEKAEDAYNTLKSENIQVKYSYYKTFFRIKDVNLDTDYTSLKSIFNILSDYDVNVIYFKFYTKQTINWSGDLTLDTKNSLDKLIENKGISLNEGTISFYRFKINSSQRNNELN